jgi:hypothetical protein
MKQQALMGLISETCCSVSMFSKHDQYDATTAVQHAKHRKKASKILSTGFLQELLQHLIPPADCCAAGNCSCSCRTSCCTSSCLARCSRCSILNSELLLARGCGATYSPRDSWGSRCSCSACWRAADGSGRPRKPVENCCRTCCSM